MPCSHGTWAALTGSWAAINSTQTWPIGVPAVENHAYYARDPGYPRLPPLPPSHRVKGEGDVRWAVGEHRSLTPSAGGGCLQPSGGGVADR
jgi:hypothetical protein